MSYIDIIIVLFLLYGAVRGYFKGLVIEVATLLGLVLGVYLAMKYSVYIENILRDFLNLSEGYLHPVGWGVTFVLVAIAIYLLGKMLTNLVAAVSLGLVNKLAGMVLGVMKYFVILCILLMIVNALDDSFGIISSETKEKSIFYRPFLNFATSMYHQIRG